MKIHLERFDLSSSDDMMRLGATVAQGLAREMLTPLLSCVPPSQQPFVFAGFLGYIAGTMCASIGKDQAVAHAEKLLEVVGDLDDMPPIASTH